MSSENLNNLSIKDLKKLIDEEYKQNKKLRQDKEKEELIQVYKKFQDHKSLLIHICKKCLSHLNKLDLFEKHITYCSQNETLAVKMPIKNTILNFQNHYKKLPIPFVVYADF